MASLILGDGMEKYLAKLNQLYEHTEEISEKVVMSGANIIADEIRNKLLNLPEEAFHRLNKESEFNGVPVRQKNDLLKSLGITPLGVDDDGNKNVKVGFDGYGTLKTKKYKNGVPNVLLARAIESGSSVRKKTPFVRPSVNKKKKKAIEEMGKTLETEIKIYEL